MLADWISPPQVEIRVNNVADVFEEKMTIACDFALPRKYERRDGKKPQHWWSPEIPQLRSRCTAARRALKRTVARQNRDSSETETMKHLLENLRSSKRGLKILSDAPKEMYRNSLFSFLR